MKKVKIIRESNLQDFENIINQLISEGWETSGNIIVDKNFHYQKMKMKNRICNKIK